MKAHLVLVVEDDRDSMDAIVEVLEFDGYRCARAANGTEALACLRWGMLPEIILLELTLPDMTGDEFLSERKRLALAVDAKIVLMSGVTGLEGRAAELGTAGWFQKPIQVEILLRTVRWLTAR